MARYLLYDMRILGSLVSDSMWVMSTFGCGIAVTELAHTPCMSALQALERTCDQMIKAGIPIKTLR